MSSNVEQKIGKYEVLTKIGEGGMGVVYKAKDPLIDRIVAIKMMTGAFSEEKESRERFLREARAVGKLQHPNIVTIYELGVEGNSPYMVMEFLEGQGLDKILSNRVALTMVQKLEYMEQICNALHYAHEHDIVHRDVKPANVIVMKGGSQVKLVDFGIARAGNSGMTKTGFAIGTTSYMSPEQIEASKGLDRRSDVFSTGVMMYEVLTNNLPFPGTEPIAIAIKILREPFPRLAAYLAEYPAELDDIMNRSLAKDREERYSTAEEMAFDLSRLIEQLKRNMVSQYVVEGKESFDKKDFGRAKELISYVLKIDPGNSQARALNYEIQKMAQQAQKGEHLRQLKAAIEETIGQRQYDEALNFIEQALKIDTKSTELLKQKELVLAEQQRRAEVKKRLNLAQSAEAMGDFRMAREHVEKALSLDPTDTQARMQKANIEQAIAEQEKQKQIRDFLDVAKTEMVERRFTSAREAIKRAEALQPDSPEIQALKAAAYSGHEQELKRRELEQFARDVQASLAAGDPDAAWKKANSALQMYPTDVTLLQLRGQAEQARAEKATERAKKDHLSKAKDALGRKNYEAAIGELEGARIEFPADKEIADLLRLAREERDNAKFAAEKATQMQAAAQAQAAAAAAEAAARKKAEEERQRAEEKARHDAEEKRRAEEKAHRDAEEKERKAAEEKARREAREADERRRREEEEKKKAADKQRAEEEKKRKAAEAARIAAEVAAKLPQQPSSATNIFSAPSSGAAAAPAPSAYEETIVSPPAPKKKEVVKEKPRREEPVYVPPAATGGGKGKMIGIGAAVAVLVIGAASYFIFKGPSKPDTGGAGTGATSGATTGDTSGTPGTGTPSNTTSSTTSSTTAGTPAPVLGSLSVEAKDDKGAALDGADIFVDNQLKDVQIQGGKATIQLAPGKHKVRVEKPGYKAGPVQNVTIAKNAEARLAFALTKTAEVVATVVNPYLMITSTPNASVSVDGNNVGTVGADGKASFQVPPGSHKIDIAMRGFRPGSATISAEAGKRVPVTVALTAIPAPSVDFSPANSNIEEGKSVELKWNVQGATDVTIEGLGAVSASGSRSVSPNKNTTYRLVAKGEGGDTTATAVVNVAAPAAPVIGAFSASPAGVTKGGSTKLTWSTQNATDVSISGIGKVDASGSRDIPSVDSTTTYRLTAKGPGGNTDKSVTVNVTGPSAAEAAAAAADAARQKEVADATAAVNSFKAAYESKNIDALAQAWPSIPAATRKALSDTFKMDSRYSFTCKAPNPTGDTTQATCAQVATLGGKTYNAVITLDLAKTSGTWRVVGLKGR